MMRWAVLVLALAGCAAPTPAPATRPGVAPAPDDPPETFRSIPDAVVSAALARIRLAEVEEWLEFGRRELFFGDLDRAARAARKVLDLAALLPPEMDVELRMDQAEAILDWVKVFREEE